MAIFYALLCVGFWSLVSVIAKKGQSHLDSYQFLFWSNCFSLLSVFAAGLLSKKSFITLLIIRRSTLRQTAILGGLDGLFYVLLYSGYHLENGIAVLTVQYSWPLLIVILSIFIFGYRLTFFSAVGIFLGILSVIITLTKGHLTTISVAHPYALILVFIAAFCFALLSVLSKRFAVDAYIGTLWLFIFSTLLSAFFVFLFSTPILPPWKAWGPLLLNGVFINGLSYILWVKAIRIGDAAKISALVFLSPVMGTIWLVYFFHEPFISSYAAGVSLAVLSGMVCLLQKEKTPLPAPLSLPVEK